MHIHYQFSDLDLTAEVDQKKLLIDLYDRGLISKATVQQKMGLSPAVEARVSAEEDVVVDRNWTVEDISRLVALEVLSVDEARGRLGIVGAGGDATEASSLADVTRLYAKREEKIDE